MIVRNPKQKHQKKYYGCQVSPRNKFSNQHPDCGRSSSQTHPMLIETHVFFPDAFPLVAQVLQFAYVFFLNQSYDRKISYQQIQCKAEHK